MKKFLYSGMALTAMLSMASCSSDDVASDLAGDGVTVTLRLPSGLESKATFGDKTTVTLDELKYTVFEKAEDGTNTIAFSDERSAFGANKYTETETIKLGKGKDYTIVFYADQKGNGFVTFTDGNISVNYDALSSNNEDYDAFYSVVEVPNGTTSISTTLNRPFSQLNWGTDDLAEPAVTAKLDGLTATVKVTNGLYTGMNLLTGEVTGDAVADAVTFTAVNLKNDAPAETFPVEGYDLLAMNYLLTGEGTIDCELEFSNGFSPVTVSAAPVKTNYRTNIYGSLLTNPVNFNIKVDKNFETPDYVVWTGNKTPVEPDGNNYSISSPAQLAYIADLVNNGDNMAGKTITLTNDLDLNNVEWTPIGNESHPFAGNFDGNGHIVKNLKIDLDGKPFVAAGLFGKAWNPGTSTFKNVTIENVNINTTGATTQATTGTGALAGGLGARLIEGIIIKNVTINSYRQSGGIFGAGYTRINNCEVSGANITLNWELLPTGTYDNCDKAGAICGLLGEDGYYVTNNKVENITLTGYRDMGGLLGMDGYAGTNPQQIDGNTVKNVTIYKIPYATATFYGSNVNDLIGRKGSSKWEINGTNTVEDVNIIKKEKE